MTLAGDEIRDGSPADAEDDAPAREKKPTRSWISDEELAAASERCRTGAGMSEGLASSDFERFGFLTVWLSGLRNAAGEKDTISARRAALEKCDPDRFIHLFDQVRAGGQIISFGASNGDEALGILAELTTRFNLTETRFLVTDYSDYSLFPDTLDKFAVTLTDANKRWYVDQPRDFYLDMTDAHVDRGNWRDYRRRVIRRYGEDWDAAQLEVFANARHELGGELGLMILRHPEIGNQDNEKLANIFRAVIANLLQEVVRSQTPLVITTSNNEISRQRIREEIEKFRDAHPDFVDHFDFFFGETPDFVRRELGGRVMDSYIFVVMPKLSQTDFDRRE